MDTLQSSQPFPHSVTTDKLTAEQAALNAWETANRVAQIDFESIQHTPFHLHARLGSFRTLRMLGCLPLFGALSSFCGPLF